MAIIAISVLFPGTAVGADGSLEVLQVGWDGNLVPGSWNPVRVRVTGGSADAAARVEVVMKARYQPGPQATPIDFPVGAYGQEVALPSGVTKELTIWVPANNNPGGPVATGAVQLTVGGKLLAEEGVEFKSARTPFWPVIGVLAESPSVARAISQVEIPYQGLPVPLSAARLSPGDLPPMAERLGALKALVVQGNVAATLTNEQRQAVQQWVAAGGHLLVAGGPDAARAAAVLPSGALPISFSGSDSAADLSGLVSWADSKQMSPLKGPAARFQSSAGTVLSGTSERPLAWRFGLGQGTVTLLAADPALEPFSTWDGTPGLLRKALEPAMPSLTEDEKMRYVRAMEGDLSNRLSGVADAMPADTFPGWQVVALILGGFALFVGPLVHVGLSRTDRRVWMWVAVPVAAILLSGVLYLVGIGRGGRDVLVNLISYVRLDEGSQPRQTLLAGFYAPTHSQLDVTVPGDVPVRTNVMGEGYMPAYMSGRPNTPSGVSTEPPFHIIGGRDTHVEFRSGQWSMRSVMLDRSLGAEVGRITGRLGIEGGLIKGTLRNDTPYMLEDAAVVVGQNLERLGSLAPGQTAQVVLDPGALANPFQGGPGLSWRLFGRPVAEGAASSGQVVAVARPVSAVAPMAYSSSAMIAPGMPERLEIPRDPEVQRRMRLMDSVMNKPQMGPGMPMVPLTFVAFTTAPLGKDFPNAGDHPTYHLSFLEQPLRLDMPPGPFSIPPALTPVDVVEQSGGYGGGSNGTVSWIELRNGSMIYGFHPPVPAKAKPEALVIRTQQMGASSAAPPGGMPGKGMPPGPNMNPIAAEAGVFSLYNWQSAAWEPLPAGQEQTRVQPAAAYFGPDGTVRLRASAGLDRVVQFVIPDLTVEGRVEE